MLPQKRSRLPRAFVAALLLLGAAAVLLLRAPREERKSVDFAPTPEPTRRPFVVRPPRTHYDVTLIESSQDSGTGGSARITFLPAFLNARGDVVGDALISPKSSDKKEAGPPPKHFFCAGTPAKPCCWSRLPRMTPPPLFFYGPSWRLLGLSDDGGRVFAAAGVLRTPETFHLFVWDARGWHDRGVLPGEPIAFSSSGDAVLSPQRGNALLRRRDGSVLPLTPPPGCPVAINRAGQIVGAEQGRFSPVLIWNRGIAGHASVAVPISAPAAAYTPVALNDQGNVLIQAGSGAGEAPLPSSYFLWKDKRLHRVWLPPGLFFAGGPQSLMNDRGRIVGLIYNPETWQTEPKYEISPWEHGAYCWQDGALYDLNDALPPGAGWRMDMAVALNNRGQILAQGTKNGKQRGFLLTPR